jgi:hypothetical protein
LLAWTACGPAGPRTAPQSESSPSLRPEQTATYAGAWEYHFGDSPRDARGDLLWARPRLPPGTEFRPISLPGTPPGRGDHRFLWLRTQLSGPAISDPASRPALFLLVVDQIFEAYIDGKRVYAFGVLDGEGPHVRRFLGYKPHYIPLDATYQGKTLSLRIYSDHVNIGVVGEPVLGSQLALLQATVVRGQGKFVTGAILIVLGLAALGLWLAQRDASTTLYYAGFALACGVWIVCQAQSRILFLNNALLWVHVEMWTLYLIPGFLLGYLTGFLGPGPFDLNLRLMQVFWLYVIGAALLVFLGGVPLMSTWLPGVLLMMSTAVYITGMTLLAIWQGHAEARIYFAGQCIAVLCFMYDTLNSLGILPRRDTTTSHLGIGTFVLSLGVLAARRFVLLQREHRAASIALQQNVQEAQKKSAELRALNDELMRQIDQRSRRLLDALLARIDEDGADPTAGIQPLSAGSLLSEAYRVIRPVGAGGFGAVYEVERVADGRHLAAKIIAGSSNRGALLRFGREAQLLSRLHHENLVSIFDVDVTADARLFIIMELVQGVTLREVRQRYGDLRWALPILQQIAQGLAAVHEQGIVHRDLKPANILLAAVEGSEAPRVKLVDFGISVLARDEGKPESTPTPSKRSELPSELPDATRTGVLIGTPAYMAPELWIGSRLAQVSSDIFSFGVIAYELLTRKMPYESPAVRAILRSERLPIPAELRSCPELDPALTALLERCLGVDPGLRPTAAELAQALTQALASLPPAA